MLQKKELHQKRRLVWLLLLIVTLSLSNWHTGMAAAEENGFNEAPVERADLEAEIKSIVEWKKTQFEPPDEALLTNTFLENAGETSVDWFVIGLGRTGMEDNFAGYTAVIKDKVAKRYQTEAKLSESKATEWHRISLAILAAGGDPTNVGENVDGDPIDLIADGTYDRGKETRSLGTQGINGWIWGLITLDTMRYNIPDGAVETRNSIIEEILRAQLEDGGFALSTFDEKADVDLTAMAIQALAPYYNSEEEYTYEQMVTGEKMTKTVREVIDEALDVLSDLQSDNGDFDMGDIANVESTAQVIVALTSLGIDPLTDERFIKKDRTLLDAILSYKQSDGGFIHSETYDADNEYAAPDESNSLASEQVLYTLTALYRFYDGKRSLYDFREEMSAETEKAIEQATEAIESTVSRDPVDPDELKKAFERYEAVPITERSYVYNYAKLSNAMEEAGMENTSRPIAEQMGQNDGGEGYNPTLFEKAENETEDLAFTEEDEQRVASLSDKPSSTEYYVEVTSLIDKIQTLDETEEHDTVLAELEDMKSAMEEKEAEIQSINRLILDELYPFHTITKDDQDTVDEITRRYEALEAYDQDKIQDYEAVEKAATQIDNANRATYITIGIIAVIALLLILLIIRYRKRKKAKLQRNMLDNAE
ncbi:MAG TPA: prenyltransferase/squalene oxidase repeat-containing protein [Virgibacillus sp.]|nr:prenyltransferase/squalene oxidase repeat-containing protein [Virgibacillus sp.]